MAVDGTGQNTIATLTITGIGDVDIAGHVTLGRDPKSDGQIIEISGDPLVSKSHLAIDTDTDGFTITDLGSSNGTYVHHTGGETTVPTDRWIPLPSGAEIEFGDQRLTITPVVAVDATAQHGSRPHPAAPVPVFAPADPWGAGVAGSPGHHHEDHPIGSIECGACQRSLPAGSKFCDGCGTPVEADDPTPPNAPAPWSKDAMRFEPDPGVGQTVVVPAGESAPAPIQPGPPQPAPPVVSFASAQPSEPVFVDPATTSGGPGRKIAAGAAGLVVLGLLGFGLVAVLRSDVDESADSGFVEVPEQLDEQWRESVRGTPRDVTADDSAVYVGALNAGAFEVTSFGRSDGDELWTADIDDASLSTTLVGVAGGILIVQSCADECDVFAFETSTGDEVWNEQFSGNGASIVDNRLYSEEARTFSLLDPATGDRIDRIRGEFFDLTIPGFVVAASSDDFEVFDLDLAPVFGPVDIEDEFTAGAFDGEELVVAIGDDLRYIDTNGDVIRETRVDVELITRIAVVNDANLILDTEQGTLSIDPRNDDAEERWSERESFRSVADVDGGPVVIVQDGDDFDVVDADSGERRFDGDFAGSGGGGQLLEGQNALVVFESDGDDVDLSAYDWRSGDRIWTDSFEMDPSFTGGLLIALTDDGDVTVFG